MQVIIIGKKEAQLLFADDCIQNRKESTDKPLRLKKFRKFVGNRIDPFWSPQSLPQLGREGLRVRVASSIS